VVREPGHESDFGDWWREREASLREALRLPGRTYGEARRRADQKVIEHLKFSVGEMV
jgi:hypothetical protein